MRVLSFTYSVYINDSCSTNWTECYQGFTISCESAITDVGKVSFANPRMSILI